MTRWQPPVVVFVREPDVEAEAKALRIILKSDKKGGEKNGASDGAAHPGEHGPRAR